MVFMNVTTHDEEAFNDLYDKLAADISNNTPSMELITLRQYTGLE